VLPGKIQGWNIARCLTELYSIEPVYQPVAFECGVFMTRKNSICLLLLACSILVSLCVPAQQAAPPVYVVVAPVANMYREGTQESDVVSQAIYSTNVRLVENAASVSGWLHVRTPDDYTGWMQSAVLKRLDGKDYASSGPVVRVAQRSANIYREPDVTMHAPLITVPWESRLELVDEKVGKGERWLKVRLPDGRQGFVQQGDVSSDFTPLTIDQMIALAKNFLGITYTWGGTSTFGYDCSGFVQMLVRQRGILMPRDADVQAAWSGVYAVERKDLQAGDLLYFGSSPSKISHTGMYIGNGQFIHDTTNTHPMVQISNLDDMPWTKLLVAARRVKSQQHPPTTPEANNK
jgi:SH3-like domain-containing protein